MNDGLMNKKRKTMEDEPQWETVCTEGCTNGYGRHSLRAYVRRLPVPSGWLYETLDYDHRRSDLAKLRNRLITFVPHPPKDAEDAAQGADQ